MNHLFLQSPTPSDQHSYVYHACCHRQCPRSRAIGPNHLHPPIIGRINMKLVQNFGNLQVPHQSCLKYLFILFNLPIILCASFWMVEYQLTYILFQFITNTIGQMYIPNFVQWENYSLIPSLAFPICQAIISKERNCNLIHQVFSSSTMLCCWSTVSCVTIGCSLGCPPLHTKGLVHAKYVCVMCSY